MSDTANLARARGKTLLIVEGEHEKNGLFWLLFKCFPEMDIQMEDVQVYGTNIYMLYEDIVKEYGQTWAQEQEDIDLPFIISKKKNERELLYKINFTNIILVFDYERHDPRFSEVHILEMQRAFNDATDMGQLYINYPMIEAYEHLRSFPDTGYAQRKIETLQAGKIYKAMVAKESVIRSLVVFPHRMEALLEKRFNIQDMEKKEICLNTILSIKQESDLDVGIQEALGSVVAEEDLKTAKYQLQDWIGKQQYLPRGQTFWAYTREVFRQIMIHNLCKANLVQKNQYDMAEEMYKDCYTNLDFEEILVKQNVVSGGEADASFIWVLSTCVLFVGEYKFFWE